jgi:mRNA interferase MazF
MKQFDVYIVNLDPAKGSEMKKPRPSVIVSPNVMNRHLNTILVCPLTHTIKRYPSRVLSRFKRQKGEVVLDQIRAVDKRRLIKKIGRVDKMTAVKIKRVLNTMFS